MSSDRPDKITKPELDARLGSGFKTVNELRKEMGLDDIVDPILAFSVESVHRTKEEHDSIKESKFSIPTAKDKDLDILGNMHGLIRFNRDGYMESDADFRLRVQQAVQNSVKKDERWSVDEFITEYNKHNPERDEFIKALRSI